MAVSGERAPAFSWDKGGNHVAALALEATLLKDTKRNLTSQEEDALAAMKRRDEDIEKQIEELGQAVGRLDPLARQIGQTAERHRLRAEALGAEVDKTEGDIQQLNRLHGLKFAGLGSRAQARERGHALREKHTLLLSTCPHRGVALLRGLHLPAADLTLVFCISPPFGRSLKSEQVGDNAPSLPSSGLWSQAVSAERSFPFEEEARNCEEQVCQVQEAEEVTKLPGSPVAFDRLACLQGQSRPAPSRSSMRGTLHHLKQLASPKSNEGRSHGYPMRLLQRASSVSTTLDEEAERSFAFQEEEEQWKDESWNQNISEGACQVAWV
eukprot:s5896_g1.t1